MKSEMGPGRELKGTGGFVAGPRVASSSLVRLRGKLGETRQGLEGWVLGEEEWQASGQWFSDQGGRRAGAKQASHIWLGPLVQCSPFARPSHKLSDIYLTTTEVLWTG